MPLRKRGRPAGAPTRGSAAADARPARPGEPGCLASCNSMLEYRTQIEQAHLGAQPQ